MISRASSFTAALFLIAVSTAALACPSGAGLTWQPEIAVALGSGCSTSAGDTMILAAGSDVSIVTSRLAVRIPADDFDTALTGLENCAARVPLTLEGGYYIDQITQSIRYGVDKTAGTSARIQTTASFLELPAVTLSVDVPLGALTGTNLTATSTSPFMTAASCSAEDRSGLFRADAAITGNRAGAGQYVRVGAVDTDFRHDMTLSTEACP